MTSASGSANIERLTPLWERVFPNQTVTPDSNFFALGGDPLSARELAAQLSSLYKRQISPLVIYQAPSIVSLAALLAEAQPMPLPALLPLTAALGNPPVFIAHGLGDTVMNLSRLANSLQVAQTVYGMQARGLDGGSRPLDTIEAMADCYLPEIRHVQSAGPYFLIGYSLGGLVVLEVARRLSAAGEKVGLLAMLDSYPDRHQLSLDDRIRLDLRLAKRRVLSLATRSSSKATENNDAFAIAMQRVKDAQYRALRGYRPSFYDGEVKFVRATILSGFPSNPARIWSRYVRKVDVETLPGNHLQMLTDNAILLGTLLRRYLGQARP